MNNKPQAAAAATMQQWATLGPNPSQRRAHKARLLLVAGCALLWPLALSSLPALGAQQSDSQADQLSLSQAPQPGAMLSMGSESASALESSASLVAADDLMAAESSHSTSVEPLVVEPHKQQQQQHLQRHQYQQPAALAGGPPAQQHLPNQIARGAPSLHQQHQQFSAQRVPPQLQPRVSNPYALAAALAGNYGPAQQQLAAAAVQAARQHPGAHLHPLAVQGPHQLAAQESSVRQNVVPAPSSFNAAPVAVGAVGQASQQLDSNSIEQPEAAPPTHQLATTSSNQLMAVASSVQQPVLAASASNGELAGSSSWPLQAPDIPKIVNLEVKCEKNLMKVSVEFDKAFNGLIFSKGHYSQGQCVHVSPNSGKQQAYFDISINSCGTQGNTQNGLYGMGGNTGSGTFFENTIVIQYDPNVQEVYDHARKLRCTWHDQYEKAVTFRPFPVDMLDIVRADFAGDNVGCWMQIQVGKGPWASEVAGIVKIGQTMTMVLAIKDEENKFDMLVRNCFAHDGKRGPIELVDKSGCITRPKLMSRFTKIKNFGSSATVLSYAHFQAFKFPDSMEVHFQCTIQICRHQCPEQCSAGGPGNQLGGASAGLHGGESYSESTISGTFNINGGAAGSQAQPDSSIHLRKYGSAQQQALSRARRDIHPWAHRNGSHQLHEPVQQHQLARKALTQTVGLNRVIQVVSTGDLAFALPQQQQSESSPEAQRLEAAQQICVSSYSFVLGLALVALILLCSSLASVAIYLRQRRQLSANGRSQSKLPLPMSPSPVSMAGSPDSLARVSSRPSLPHVPTHQAHLYAPHHHRH